MSELVIAGLRKAYGTQAVLRGLDLRVATGSLVAVLGPSGSGKTTLLRIIAGFERAEQGSVTLDGRVVDDDQHFVDARERRVGYVPQDGQLFPHLTVAANVGFGLARPQRRGARVHELLDLVGLGGYARRYPHELSGGQQQRVALARGLAIEPSLVLLDEPFSSLDAGLRAAVRRDVQRVLRDAGATTILVTHDQDEALSLADRVAVIHDGVISQLDAPAALYARPVSPELAREVGHSNFLAGRAHDGVVDTALGTLTLHDDDRDWAERDARVLVLVRPEQIELGVTRDESSTVATVLETEFYGHDAIVKLRVQGCEDVVVARTAQAISLPAREESVTFLVRGPVVAWPA